MLTFTPVNRPARYSRGCYPLFENPRQATPLEKFLDSLCHRAEGSLFYGTQTAGDYLIDRAKLTTLYEDKPISRYVVEFPASYNLVLCNTENYRELVNHFRVSALEEIAQAIRQIDYFYEGVYCDRMVLLFPQARLTYSPSYRAYLESSAEQLPETMYANFV